MRILAPCLAALLAGCLSLPTQRFADTLSQGILNQNDPATVEDGAPAYLLLLDGLIEENPDDRDLLLAAARLNGAYATVFVEDPERARRLTAKALDYARRALCREAPRLCQAEQLPFADFEALLPGLDRDDLPLLFAYAAAWAGWIEARSGDWDALADLPKVQALMERVAALDEAYQQGQPHLYLGVLYTLRPAALGGRLEDGRRHLQRAIDLSGGRNLQAKVEMARRYARMTFDRALHDRLLDEVLAADPQAPGLTLGNVLAQRQARRLRDESDSYFLE